MRVLVTRPEPGASATAKKLRHRGYEAVVLPLSEIRPLDPMLPDAAGIDAVAATSANAFRHLDAEKGASLIDKPCFTVGGRTAQAARDAGFVHVRTAEGDAGSLARMLASEMPSGSRIVYLCGRIRGPAFEAELEAAGLVCLTAEIYDTAFIRPDAKDVRTLLVAPPDAVFLYSARSAKALKRIALRRDLAASFDKARFLCLSEAVARALGTLGQGRTYWTIKPDEEALFALLAQA